MPLLVVRIYLVFAVLIVSGVIVAQPLERLPSYYPVASSQYGVPEGLPDPCVALAHINQEGKLVLVSCNHVRVSFDLYVYFFDGHTAWPSTFDIEEGDAGVYSWFKGFSPEGMIYGYYYDKANWDEAENTFFFIYDPDTGNKKMYPFGRAYPHKGVIESVSLTDEGYFILTREIGTGICEVFRIKDDTVTSVTKITLEDLKPVYENKIPSALHLAVTPSDIWVASATNVIYKISRKTVSQERFRLADSATQRPLGYLERLMVTPEEDVLFYSVQPMKLFRWDRKANVIQAHAFLPGGWKPEDVLRVMLTRDETGNLLIVHQRKDKKLKAILQDMDGNYFDYTPVIAHLEDVRYLGELESNWSSRDFRKELLTTSYDFLCIEVASAKPIQAFPTSKGARNMLELDNESLYVRPVGVLSMTDGTWKEHPVMNTEFGESIADLLTDASGRVWSSSEDKFNVYEPASGSLRQITTPEFIYRFAFLEEGRLVYISNSNQVYFLDMVTGVSTLQPIKRLPAYINQIHVDGKDVIWVATSEGLIKIDRASGDYDRIDKEDGLGDARIIRIHQDKRGRFWLGTFFGGVQIYDPVTGTVKIINESQGLSNNTVVTILEDDDGFIWAGTYNGVTILHPEGEIFGQIFKQDGLVDNECNRWSSYKLRDGRLCIGSIGGLSIIEPRMLRNQMEQHYKPLIYLTKLGRAGRALNVFQSAGEAADSTGHFHLALPAGDRSLHMGFALSNYSAPGKSSFAYKIEGYDTDWNYIGSQNEITLNRLPAGKYRILVSGADHRGKRTEDPVIIEVDGEEFFYLKWWFYGLLLIPVAGGTLFYQYRQRQENKKLELEVARRTETIQQQADQLREMDVRKSHMYANITHEFRTPLTVIEGMTGQMGTDPKAPELIKRNTRNLLHLVNQMLDLSKLESGAMPLNLVQYDILELIRYIAESFRSLAASKNVHFHFLTDESGLVMDFDPEKIRQVISNLLSNAIKFTPKGGEVYLQVDAIRSPTEGTNGKGFPDRLMIKVRDTGIGIPEDKVQHIFKRFYQVDPGSTRVGEGTGIGLTLVSELLRLMGGDISVISQPGQGTSFTVLLPVHRHAPVVHSIHMQEPGIMGEVTVPEAEVLTGEPQDERVEMPLVLVVEDSADVIHYITSCLRSQYKIIVAKDGREGVDIAVEQIPDVIISDVMMPVMDGFELCETLKNDFRTSHIPVLLLTARADVESRITGLRRGADAYLAKPFDRKELVAQLENLIDNRRKLQVRYAGMDLTPGDDPGIVMEHEFISRFRQYVESNLDDEELDVNDICRALALSRAQLHRKVKALTGKSTSALVRSIRLEKAKLLLTRPDLNITQVAYEVGFRYPEYFSRAFSEEFGMSPSQWLEQKTR